MTRREVLLALAVGTGVTVVSLVFVLRPFDSVVAGVLATVLTAVAASRDVGAHHPWPRPVPAEPDGARSAVSSLMWGFAGRDGTVSEAALRALRRQAGRRLAPHGVVLEDGRGYLLPAGDRTADDDAGPRALLGDHAWAVLTSRGDLPTIRDVARCVDALEQLAPDHPERRR
ncbi:hypothetical protein [Cellulomonas sp. ATA003]|uniref:hypothetical protein n=1 Tax=Cellulomonas sp. ATA003 TaxID=3073064 RepID=UPI0028733AC4|nr:hypothetical protein [Cellulomonas sp. ATA003]WNB85813.1 hypothetical protein REH70_00190 [Cellulomonas sp. ATA003]